MRLPFRAAGQCPGPVFRFSITSLLLVGCIAWAQSGTAQAASCAANVSCTGSGPDAVRLQAFVDGIVSPKVLANQVGGAIVGVTWQGRRSYFGYGFGTTPAFAPNTIVEIGSITKVFTTALFAEAVSEAKMNFDDPLRGYMTQLGLGQLNWCARNITLRQLANFSSSMPEEPTNAAGQSLENLPPSQKSIEYFDSGDFLAWLANWKPKAMQGTDCNLPYSYIYSNASIGILGYAVANVISGNNNAGFDTVFDGALQKRITGPLKMTSTSYGANLQFPNRTAKGYEIDAKTGKIQEAPLWPKYAWFPAGELRTDAEDMLAFGAAALGNANINNSPTTPVIKELEDALRISMTTVCPVYQKDGKTAPLQEPNKGVCPNYNTDGSHLLFYQGLAWVKINSMTVGSPSPTLFYKDGGTAGFKSVIVVDPADDLAIFVALDSAQTNAQSLGTGLATVISGLK